MSRARSAFRLIYCLAFFAACLAVAAGEPEASGSRSIPIDQLGAEAQKQRPGSEGSLTSTGTGALLKAVMQDIQAEAGPDGLWLTSVADEDQSRPNRFRIRATTVGRFDAVNSSLLASALPSRGEVQVSREEGVAAAWLRSGLIEEYTVSADGVRQDFVIPARLPGGGDQLFVDLVLDGVRAEASPHGAKLTVSATGRELAYSRLKVTDATGRALSAGMQVISPDRIRLAVRDAGAVYPVRIDPTFSDADWVSISAGFPGVKGDVRALAVDSEGNVYVGGYFTLAGNVFARNIAKWDGTGWSALGSGIGDNTRLSNYAPVFAMVTRGTDLYVGGDFADAGGVSVNHVAKWDGSAWSALGGGVVSSGDETPVSVLAVSGSEIYAGGGFVEAGGVPGSRGIARWNGIAWSALGTGGGIHDGNVYALAVSGGNLWAGGDFLQAGGVFAPRIAKWDGSAWSKPGGDGFDRDRTTIAVRSLAVVGSSVYAGVNFYPWPMFFTQTPYHEIARYDCGAWTTIQTGPYEIGTMAVKGSDLYLAAPPYSGPGLGQAFSGLAKWDGSAWSDIGGGGIRAIAFTVGSIYAGGDFSTIENAGARSIAKWEAGAWSGLTPGLDGEVKSLLLDGTDLYIAGSFSCVGGIVAKGLAKWNGSVWSAIFGQPNGDVLALAVYGNNLYAGGSFTSLGYGIDIGYLAKWNGSGWSKPGAGVEGEVRALVVKDGALYAGGGFRLAANSSVRGIAKWNGSAWSALSGIDGSVFIKALAAGRDGLYAGGSFTISGVPGGTAIARWNENAGWSALGAGVEGTVEAMAVSGRDVYAARTHSPHDGLYPIVKWNGSAWSELGVMDAPVGALAVSAGDLYAGGSFLTTGPVAARRIAKWDGRKWSPLGSGMDNAVSALAVSGSDLFAGGAFYTAGDKVSPFLARAKIAVGLEAWRSRYFDDTANAGNAADSATPQGDGLANLVKFALGMDPTVPGVNPAVLVRNGAVLEFTCPRSVAALGKCTLIFEWSDTLAGGSWSSTGVSQQILSDDGILQQVQAMIPAGSGDRRFVRMRVTNP